MVQRTHFDFLTNVRARWAFIAKGRIASQRIRPRIVRITVVVMLLVDDVPLGGGGGAAMPGEPIVPANAETASAIIRIEIAHARRNFVTLGAS